MPSSTRPGQKSIREQGNEAFKSGEWEKAINLYTEALDADYIPHRVDKEHLSALYSNRAAAYVKRCNYYLAQLDVNCIFRLKPEWFRGHERQGMIFEGLRDFESAKRSYGQAAEAAKQDSRYRGLADGLLKRQASMARLATRPSGKSDSDWQYETTRARLLANGETLDNRPAARIALMARDLMNRGWNRFFDADLEHDADEGFAGLWGVIEGYFYSGNAIRNYTERAPPILLSLKQVNLMKIEYPKVLKWDVMDLGDPDERTRQVISLAKKEGWKAFRGRERWILGYLKNAMVTAIREVNSSSPERSLLWLESAMTMAEGLQAEFAELREGATGDDLELHLYRARTIAMSARMFRLGGDAEYTRKVVEPLQALSEKLFDHAVANFASTPEHEDPLLDTVYRKQPLAHTLWAQAWCLRIRAHWPENLRHEIRPVAWCNVEMLRTAATLARKAAELVSVDEEFAPRYLEFALRCDILAGGLRLDELAEKAAEIERQRIFNSRFWGPSDDTLADLLLNRLFSRQSEQVLKGADTGLFLVNEVVEPYFSPWIRPSCLEVTCAQPAVFYCTEGEAEKYDGPKTYAEALRDPKVAAFLRKHAPSEFRPVDMSPATFEP